MITPIVKDNKVVFGPCRLSYTHLFEKYAPDGTDQKDAKYQTCVLIPKKEKETIEAIKKAIEAGKQLGIVKKWGGKEPKKLDLALRDGDDKENGGDEYNDVYYVNAKCSARPGIVDRNKKPIVDEEEVYSGVWAIVSVSFSPYDVSGKRGVSCWLNNVMKFKDDEKFGGGASAETDFADVNFDDEDDDEL